MDAFNRDSESTAKATNRRSRCRPAARPRAPERLSASGALYRAALYGRLQQKRLLEGRCAGWRGPPDLSNSEPWAALASMITRALGLCLRRPSCRVFLVTWKSSLSLQLGLEQAPRVPHEATAALPPRPAAPASLGPASARRGDKRMRS